MKRIRISFVFSILVFLLPNLAPSETVRVPVSRDLWVSSAPGEEEGNNGKASRLKLKGYQEFSLLDFDLSKLKGRLISKATLHVKLAGDQRLRRIGVSTLGAEWVEGTGSSYAKEPGSSSFRWQKNLDTPWALGTDYSDLTLVMFDRGGTFWSQAEASEPEDGWQTIEVDPKVVMARMAGLSYGFVVFDDTGTELSRDADDPEKAVFNKFPNRFFYSKDQNASVAPYLTVETSDILVRKAPLTKPIDLKAETKGLPPGQAVLRWKHGGPVLGHFVTINGKEPPRSMIPSPDFSKRNESQTYMLRLRDLGFMAGEKVDIEIRGVDYHGEFGPSSKISFAVSDEQISELPGEAVPGMRLSDLGKQMVRENIHKLLPKLGGASVAVIDELDKVTEKGELIPKRFDDYLAVNHVWFTNSTGKPKMGLHSARNEFVAFQVHFTGEVKGVKPSIRFTGKTVPKTEFYRFEYVDSPIGKIADPMLPMEGAALDVNGRDTIYCELYVPKDMPPGFHKGTLLLEAGSEKLEIEIGLSVWNFTLPDTLSFLPEMNCYSLPENERDYYRLGQLHRTYVNRVPYSHRGTVDKGCAPVWDAATKTFDFAAWDRRYKQYFDGSAFADLPRGAVPVEAFYLPLHENFPISIFEHYTSKNDGNDWAGEVLSKEYAAQFRSACRNFLKHLKTFDKPGRTPTCFHFFLNNKMDYKRNGWSRASSPWLLDEPASYRDFMALAYFGKLFHEANEGVSAPARYRCDISRPQWQRNSLDGLMGVNVVGGDTFRRFNRGITDRQTDFGEFVYTYGTTCRPEEGAVQPVAWMLDAWLQGADGVVPWQTVGNAESWKKSDELALFYPGREGTPPVVASHRLKSYRRGQQDIEYLAMLQKRMNRPRWDVAQMVCKDLKMTSVNRSDYAEDAGTLEFTGATGTEFQQLRSRIGAVLDNMKSAVSK